MISRKKYLKPKKFTLALMLGLSLITTVGFANMSKSTVSFNRSLTQPGFLIISELKYQALNDDVQTSREFTLPLNSHTWTPFTTPMNGVTLLGRIVGNSKTELKIEYIVVDSKKDNAVITTPAVKVKMGERTEFTIGTKNEQITVSLLASNTDVQKN